MTALTVSQPIAADTTWLEGKWVVGFGATMDANSVDLEALSEVAKVNIADHSD